MWQHAESFIDPFFLLFVFSATVYNKALNNVACVSSHSGHCTAGRALEGCLHYQ